MSEMDEVKSDIEQARAELAATVDALSDKLDVKARAGDKVAEIKTKVEPHRTQIIAGAVGAVVLVIIVRWRRSKA
jgi:uncharacterized protein DUF3618